MVRVVELYLFVFPFGKLPLSFHTVIAIVVAMAVPVAYKDGMNPAALSSFYITQFP
jgi:hypothetical protein